MKTKKSSDKMLPSVGIEPRHLITKMSILPFSYSLKKFTTASVCGLNCLVNGQVWSYRYKILDSYGGIDKILMCNFCGTQLDPFML